MLCMSINVSSFCLLGIHTYRFYFV
uniref:Uncharacterized protein n=1 Tax=Anguilla anguilla TaxID=7936 RepID=A0A0E9XY01_ANGAN